MRFEEAVNNKRSDLALDPAAFAEFMTLVDAGDHEAAFRWLNSWHTPPDWPAGMVSELQRTGKTDAALAQTKCYWLHVDSAPASFAAWVRINAGPEHATVMKGDWWSASAPPPEPKPLPDVSTNPKAFYRFTFHIMFDDFGAAVQVLKDFGCSIVVGQYPLVERLMRGAAMGSFTNPNPIKLIEAQGTIGFATE